jgi:uncharacterized protein YjbI with pentapeptide repeats
MPTQYPPQTGALRRILGTRARWWLAAALALLGVLFGSQRLGWHRLTRAAGLTGHALAQAARLAIDVGWLLLLLAAAGLALSLGPRILAQGTIVRRLLALATRLARWLLGGAVLLAVLVLAVAVLPPRFTASRHFNTAAEELKAQNDVRATLLQALAGALLATGAYLTWRQLRVTREGQITDRYTKAVDQLGHDELDIRLGGIYALERIARDSPHDRATIEEVLTAFVRGHAPWPPLPAAPAQEAGAQQPRTTAVQLLLPDGRPAAAQDMGNRPDGGMVERQGPAADVQAAVTVLGRREVLPGGVRPLDLTAVDLRRALLDRANLQGARLYGANLRNAILGGANLQDARLDDVDLQGARLSDANLQGALLYRANLQDALLDGANLQRAGLYRANLQGALLDRANLQGALLDGANLQDAGLVDADLQSAGLFGAGLQGARLYGANLRNAILDGANLQGARLDGTNLPRMRVDTATLPASLPRVRLRGANLQGATADEGTRWPAGWDRAEAEARGVRYRPRPRSK